jgi:D-glycero-beta-D-manno-heptose 1-phosphate adenylyltransferase
MENLIKHPQKHELAIVENNLHIKEEEHVYVDYKNVVCIKPWGYEFLAYENNHIGIWFLNIKKGHQTSLHCHFKKDTIIFAIKGSAKIQLIDDEVVSLNEMSSMFLPHYNFHGISAFSDELFLLEIEIFNDKLQFSDKNDLLRINDVYNRKNTGYVSSVKVSDCAMDLEKYGYFYLNEEQVLDVVGTEMKLTTFRADNVEQMAHLANYQYNMLIEGKLFHNYQYLKEGSLLSPAVIGTPTSSVQFPDDTIKVLSLRNMAYSNNAKIIYDNEQLKLVVRRLKEENQRVVLSSGCFDIIHVGHLNTLVEAKKLGDKLIVCLSNDEQIRKLKGDDRPINNYQDRINLFKTISYVDYILLYSEDNIKKEESLGKIMKIVDPDYWVKGDDYTKEDIIKKHPYLRNIHLCKNVENKSTTNIINRIKKM